MAQEGSVAPKERVNIVYKSDVGGQKEEVELPLKVLVTGEFATKADDTPIENRKSINIDKNNFNDVMEAQELHLDFAVKDEISEVKEGEEQGDMSLSMDFKNIKDFSPDAVMQNVPELKTMFELREALKALKGPLGNVPEFRKKIQTLVEDDETRQKLLKELQIDEEK